MIFLLDIDESKLNILIHFYSILLEKVRLIIWRILFLEKHWKNVSAALRKKQHLTQAQLADLVGATAKHISEIERGITGISIDMQVLLSNHLYCSLDYLIKGQDYETVETSLPSFVIDILHCHNESEKTLFIDYLNFYDKLRKK